MASKPAQTKTKKAQVESIGNSGAPPAKQSTSTAAPQSPSRDNIKPKARALIGTARLKEAAGSGAIIAAIQTALMNHPVPRAILSILTPFVVEVGMQVLQFETSRMFERMENNAEEKRLLDNRERVQRRISEVEALVTIAKNDGKTPATEINDLEVSLAKIKVHAAKEAVAFIYTDVSLFSAGISQESSESNTSVRVT